MDKKRVNFELPEAVYSAMKKRAEDRGHSIKEYMRYAMTLAAAAYDEEDSGNSLAVVDQNNKVIKQILIPH